MPNNTTPTTAAAAVQSTKVFHCSLEFVTNTGVLLFGVGSSENGQAEFEATATEHSVVVVTNVATRRSNLRPKWYQ